MKIIIIKYYFKFDSINNIVFELYDIGLEDL